MSIITRDKNNLTVDCDAIKYDLSPARKEVLNNFFAALDGYSSSTEMVTTWLGRDPKEGGRVVIPWNKLKDLMWATINDMELTNKKSWFQRLKERF